MRLSIVRRLAATVRRVAGRPEVWAERLASQEPVALMRCAAWSFREEPTHDGGFRIALDAHVPWSQAGPRHEIPLEHVEPEPVAAP